GGMIERAQANPPAIEQQGLHRTRIKAGDGRKTTLDQAKVAVSNKIEHHQWRQRFTHQVIADARSFCGHGGEGLSALAATTATLCVRVAIVHGLSFAEPR